MNNPSSYRQSLFVVGVFTCIAGASDSVAQGNADAGFLLFEQCIGCHSLVPDRNEVGPSLSSLWGRQAGRLASFTGYSPAMQAAHFVWDEGSLDAFLESPEAAVPVSSSRHVRIADAAARAGLIAFLRRATAAPPRAAAAPPTAVAAEPVPAAGIIVSIDGPRGLTLDHGDIPGVMPAMTMPYAAKSPEVLKGLKAGDRIDFTVDPATLTILSIDLARSR